MFLQSLIITCLKMVLLTLGLSDTAFHTAKQKGGICLICEGEDGGRVVSIQSSKTGIANPQIKHHSRRNPSENSKTPNRQSTV